MYKRLVGSYLLLLSILVTPGYLWSEEISMLRTIKLRTRAQLQNAFEYVQGEYDLFKRGLRAAQKLVTRQILIPDEKQDLQTISKQLGIATASLVALPIITTIAWKSWLYKVAKADPIKLDKRDNNSKKVDDPTKAPAQNASAKNQQENVEQLIKKFDQKDQEIEKTSTSAADLSKTQTSDVFKNAKSYPSSAMHDDKLQQQREQTDSTTSMAKSSETQSTPLASQPRKKKKKKSQAQIEKRKQRREEKRKHREMGRQEETSQESEVQRLMQHVQQKQKAFALEYQKEIGISAVIPQSGNSALGNNIISASSSVEQKPRPLPRPPTGSQNGNDAIASAGNREQQQQSVVSSQLSNSNIAAPSVESNQTRPRLNRVNTALLNNGINSLRKTGGVPAREAQKEAKPESKKSATVVEIMQYAVAGRISSNSKGLNYEQDGTEELDVSEAEEWDLDSPYIPTPEEEADIQAGIQQQLLQMQKKEEDKKRKDEERDRWSQQEEERKKWLEQAAAAKSKKQLVDAPPTEEELAEMNKDTEGRDILNLSLIKTVKKSGSGGYRMGPGTIAAVKKRQGKPL